MEPIADARREAALEIQKLAEDFERDDEAAFRRTRIACWVVPAIVTIVLLGLLMIGGDARVAGPGKADNDQAGNPEIQRSPAAASGNRPAASGPLAARWLSPGPTVNRDRRVGAGVPARNDGKEF